VCVLIVDLLFTHTHTLTAEAVEKAKNGDAGEEDKKESAGAQTAAENIDMGDDGWICGQCTLQNAKGRSVCEVCGNPASSSATSVADTHTQVDVKSSRVARSQMPGSFMPKPRAVRVVFLASADRPVNYTYIRAITAAMIDTQVCSGQWAVQCEMRMGERVCVWHFHTQSLHCLSLVHTYIKYTYIDTHALK
jgi:hypothetical protein